MQPTLQVVLKELYSRVADKWEDIGVFLGIEDGKLNKIKADNSRSTSCLREMLREWCKMVDPCPTWTILTDALEALGEEKLALSIKQKYCNT